MMGAIIMSITVMCIAFGGLIFFSWYDKKVEREKKK